jgi:superfamily II DNA or RNA helicase
LISREETLVNFKNRLAGKRAEKPTDPIKLYDTLDRAHDKGPLRPAQLAVLSDWFSNHQSIRDVIVKLHTGQGKTLIGLLLLQARLNAGKGPALYLCPDNFLLVVPNDLPLRKPEDRELFLSGLRLATGETT